MFTQVVTSCFFREAFVLHQHSDSIRFPGSFFFHLYRANMLSSPFGERLREVAADSSLKVWVDIGCGEGQGTLNCIMQGVFSRDDWKDTNVVAVEADLAKWAVAKKFWVQDWAGPERCPVHVLHARVNETMDDVNADAEEYSAEQLLSAKARLLRLRRADAVVLDGGRFCMEEDWKQMKKLEPKVVVLFDPAGAAERLLPEFPAGEWNGEFLDAPGRMGLILRRRRESQL